MFESQEDTQQNLAIVLVFLASGSWLAFLAAIALVVVTTVRMKRIHGRWF